MRFLLPILCLFVFCCSSFKKNIYSINKEYNLRKKQENSSISICPPGAYFEDCGSGCGLPNCSNYDDEYSECPLVCTKGCVCIGEKVLDESLNQCVEIKDCSY